MPVAAVVVLLLVSATTVGGQEICLDSTLRVAGVTLFASRTDPHTWYYVPDEPRLSTNEAGEPEFSLVKYTAPAEASGGGASGITRARGGGVLHLLAEYGVSEDRLGAAEEALRARDGLEEDTIAGPIVFRSGTFGVVSSVLNQEAAMTRRLVGAGPAPLLEGGKVAVSTELSPEGATFLWRSFDMSHPDVALVFSMQIEGYRSPYEAEIVVDWDRVWSHSRLEARAKMAWMGAEVDALLDDLFTSGAVSVNVKGSSAPMERLTDAAYDKILQLLFDRMPKERRAGGSPGPGGMLGKVLGGVRELSPVDLFARYETTKRRLSGKARITLRQEVSQGQFVLLTGNIGPVARKWGDDPRFFRSVNLEDPTFRTREVVFSFDGDAADFEQVVNHVVVQLSKQHGSGERTLREAMLTAESIPGGGQRVVMAYPNSGDDDVDEWLGFQWRAVWSFRGGRAHDTGWTTSDAFAVPLRPPYRLRSIRFEGEPEVLQGEGVRSVLARVEWEFLGEPETRRLTLHRGAWSGEMHLVLPADRPTCRVFLEWHLRGGRTVSRGPWQEESEIVYIDELPEARDSTGGET